MNEEEIKKIKAEVANEVLEMIKKIRVYDEESGSSSNYIIDHDDLYQWLITKYL